MRKRPDRVLCIHIMIITGTLKGAGVKPAPFFEKIKRKWDYYEQRKRTD